MKNAECAESKEKYYLRFFRSLFFRIMVIFVLKTPQFSMKFHDNSKNKKSENWFHEKKKLTFCLFLSAFCPSTFCLSTFCLSTLRPTTDYLVLEPVTLILVLAKTSTALSTELHHPLSVACYHWSLSRGHCPRVYMTFLTFKHPRNCQFTLIHF